MYKPQDTEAAETVQTTNVPAVDLPRLVRPLPAIGDYILATKYSDGDPQDHWCVGFYAGITNPEKYDPPRYDVVDGEGKNFRGNGFRRIKKITPERGAWMLKHAKDIELSGRSVWHFERCSMDSLPNDERTHPLPGAPHRDQGEGSSHDENPDKERVAGCCDAACSASSFDGGGHMEWMSTAINGGECRLTFTSEGSVLRVGMTVKSATKLMESISNQLTLAKTSNPQAWVEQKWKELHRMEAASHDHSQEHQQRPEQ